MPCPLKLSCVVFPNFYRAILYKRIPPQNRNFPKLYNTYHVNVKRFLLYGTPYVFLINSISDESFHFSVFDKMFSVTNYTSEHDNYISYLFLFLKLYIGLFQKIYAPPPQHRGTWNSRIFFKFLCLEFRIFFSVFHSIPLSLIFIFFSEFRTNFTERCSSMPYFPVNFFWNAVPLCLVFLFSVGIPGGILNYFLP